MPQTTPNRMQSHWNEVKAFLKREWPLLMDVDLEEIDGEYDRLIHKIKVLYQRGDEIQIEAAIKGKINNFINNPS